MSDRDSFSRSGSESDGRGSYGSKKSPARRSPSYDKIRERSRSKRYASRSRSRSPYRRRSRHSRSRSRSYSPDYSRRSGGRRYGGYVRSRSRSPMSRRRRHLGDRDNPSVSRCIGVFGLSLYTQEQDLREIFSRYGHIDDIQVVYDHNTGRSRGFAFIYFRDVDDAIEAKEGAVGTEIDGKRIRVDYSVTQRAHTPTPGVYLGKPTSSTRDRGYGYSYGRRSPSPRRRNYSRSRSRSYSPRRY